MVLDGFTVLIFKLDGILSDGIPSLKSFPSSNVNSLIALKSSYSSKFARNKGASFSYFIYPNDSAYIISHYPSPKKLFFARLEYTGHAQPYASNVIASELLKQTQRAVAKLPGSTTILSYLKQILTRVANTQMQQYSILGRKQTLCNISRLGFVTCRNRPCSNKRNVLRLTMLHNVA